MRPLVAALAVCAALLTTAARAQEGVIDPADITTGPSGQADQPEYVGWAVVGEVPGGVGGDAGPAMLEKHPRAEEAEPAQELVLTDLSGAPTVTVRLAGGLPDDADTDLVVNAAAAEALGAPSDARFLVLVRPPDEAAE